MELELAVKRTPYFSLRPTPRCGRRFLWEIPLATDLEEKICKGFSYGEIKAFSSARGQNCIGDSC